MVRKQPCHRYTRAHTHTHTHTHSQHDHYCVFIISFLTVFRVSSADRIVLPFGLIMVVYARSGGLRRVVVLVFVVHCRLLFFLAGSTVVVQLLANGIPLASSRPLFYTYLSATESAALSASERLLFSAPQPWLCETCAASLPSAAITTPTQRTQLSGRGWNSPMVC